MSRMRARARQIIGSAWLPLILMAGPGPAVVARGAGPCETPRLLAAARSAAGSVAPVAATRVPTAGTRALTTPDGRFRLHFADPVVSGRLRGTSWSAAPASLTRVATALARAHTRLVERGGWPEPGLEGPLDLYLVAGPAPGNSRTLPHVITDPSRESGLATAVILTGPPTTWASRAVHQYLHVLQIQQSAREDLWLYEASAVALERLLGHDPDRVAGPRLVPPGPAEAGVALFLEHEARMHGTDLLRDVWREAHDRYGPNSVASIDVALRLSAATTLDEAWRTFTVWQAYPEVTDRPDLPGRPAASLPPAPPDHQVTDLPDALIGNDRLIIPAFSAAFIRFTGLDDAGAVHLDIDLDDAERAVSVDVLVSWKTAPLGWMVVPVPLSRGRGELTVPMAPGSRAVAIIRSHDPPGGEAARVEFAASAEPSFPYDLSFLAADASPGQVDVSWGTETETSMFGWLVYRATDPQGPYRQVNPLPVPSMGSSDSPLAYYFTDASVVPGTRYYYLVEGLTVDGLARRSAAVAARAAARR
ncbi:MAG: hypothetical protein ACE5IK_07190 [Acidobacteriota bacterium]